MSSPVERSMTVSAPQRVAQIIFSTSSSTDDHRLALRMVHVRWNDRPPAGDFVAHELGSYEFGNRRAEAASRGGSRVAVRTVFKRLLPAEIFSNRNIFHLRGNDAFLGIVHLGHVPTGPRPQNRPSVSFRKAL